MLLKPVLYRAQLLLLAMFACCNSMSLMAAGSEPVAMVTDMEGSVTLIDQGKKQKLAILADLSSNTQLQLEAGGQVILVYLASGQEFEIKGPSLTQLLPSEPETVSGAKVRSRGAVLAKGGSEIRIKPIKVAQAALVMRSAKPSAKLKLLNLAGTKILESRPLFKWQELQPGVSYRFELFDETGKSLLQSMVQETSLELPESLQLQDAVNYTWKVNGTLLDGKGYSNTGDFSIASADLRNQVEKIRPQPGAQVSERVAFATWLDQMNLKDEARRYWKELAEERPDATLRALARK